jgi:YggT family protein
MSAVTLTSWILGLVFGLMILLFLFRIVLTWYPQIELKRFPLNVITITTEPFLAPLRQLIPPIGGVDITPVIWLGIFSLLRELLLGQQGLLTMASRLQ